MWPRLMTPIDPLRGCNALPLEPLPGLTKRDLTSASESALRSVRLIGASALSTSVVLKHGQGPKPISRQAARAPLKSVSTKGKYIRHRAGACGGTLCVYGLCTSLGIRPPASASKSPSFSLQVPILRSSELQAPGLGAPGSSSELQATS